MSSPERQVGTPQFLTDLVGNHFRPGGWNTPGPSAANDRQGTSGVCCLGAGLVGLKGRRCWVVPSSPVLGAEMSRLSYSEMEGCRNLLGLLDNDDIMALCDTITNRLVQPEDRQGKRCLLRKSGRLSRGVTRTPSGGSSGVEEVRDLSGPQGPDRAGAELSRVSATGATPRPGSLRALPGGTDAPAPWGR